MVKNRELSGWGLLFTVPLVIVCYLWAASTFIAALRHGWAVNHAFFFFLGWAFIVSTVICRWMTRTPFKEWWK
jgi:Sec-independent protein secretion pathway component TatC